MEKNSKSVYRKTWFRGKIQSSAAIYVAKLPLSYRLLPIIECYWVMCKNIFEVLHRPSDGCIKTTRRFVVGAPFRPTVRIFSTGVS